MHEDKLVIVVAMGVGHQSGLGCTWGHELVGKVFFRIRTFEDQVRLTFVLAVDLV